METSLFEALVNYIGTNSPKAIAEALGNIGKWGATEADYIEFLTSKGYTVIEGSNGQYLVYKTGQFFGGNGTGTSVSSVFETTAEEVVVESTEVTSVTATGTGTGLAKMSVSTAGAGIAAALGIAATFALNSITEEMWSKIADHLEGSGALIDGRVPVLLDENGKTYFQEDVIEAYKNAFLENGLFEEGELYPSKDLSARTVEIQSAGMQPNDLLDYGLTKYTNPNPVEWVTESAEQEIRSSLQVWGASRKNHAFGIQISYADFEGSFGAGEAIQIADYGAIGDTFHITGNYATLENLPTFYIGAAGDALGIKIGTDNKTSLRPVYGESTDNNEFGFLGQFYDLESRTRSYYNSQVGVEEGEGEIQDDATLPTTDPFYETFEDWISELFNGKNWYPTSMPSDSTKQDPSQTGENNDDTQKDTITNTIVNPSPSPDPKPKPDYDPQPQPEPQPKPHPKPQPDPVNPNPTPDPSGDSPVLPVVSTTSADSLFCVYNPTDSQLSALGAFLWTDSIIEQVKKIWANPIDGVIALHKVYSGVVTGTSKEIQLGYVDTGVYALEVTNQFATVDCGSVYVYENKENATDYIPFTQLQLYLPFIGIQELDTNEIMGGYLHVVYRVDVYTGTCIALIYVQRQPDMPNEQLLYTFSGNASQQLPLTASDFSGAISSLLGIVGVGVASGGALGAAAATLGVAHSLTSEMVHIQHSGGLSANSGILAPRKPALIISRQNGYDANGYNSLYGYPANKTVYLSNCAKSSYVRVKDIRMQSAATTDEMTEIESLLKNGVIV